MQSNRKMCNTFSEEIWLYMDNALSVTGMAAWNSHLKTCSDCRKNYVEIRQTLEAYGRIGQDDIDDLKFEKTRQRLEQKSLLYPYSKTAAVLALAASLFIALWIGLDRSSSQEVQWDATAIDQTISELDSTLNRWEDEEWLLAGSYQDDEYIDDAIRNLQNDLTELQGDFSTF
ncbi:hypothetical protein GF407_09575 [candidate division KSB1 bacterium]|nr:hypothetical protein [candidate division KSB1 bacterium]